MATNPDREARLAAALRANLRRRKAQARARAQPAPADPAPADGREGGEACNPPPSGTAPSPRE